MATTTERACKSDLCTNNEVTVGTAFCEEGEVTEWLCTICGTSEWSCENTPH